MEANDPPVYGFMNCWGVRTYVADLSPGVPRVYSVRRTRAYVVYF